jgi:uncharacterized pyridoxamine 5'-phosphate oxidase family protein
MITSKFQIELENICKEISDITKEQPMVFATSVKNIVSARNVTTILHNNKIYFQTDENMEKVNQIRENHNVALCVENYQIQGIAKIKGTWDENKEIGNEYRKVHETAYNKYSSIKTEVVIEVEITSIKKWEYVEGLPYILFLDIKNKSVKREKIELLK